SCMMFVEFFFFFFSSRRRHTRFSRDWSSDVCSSDLKKFYPGVPFEYHFYDETLARLYTEERNTSRLVGLATGITIFISCLGLFRSEERRVGKECSAWWAPVCGRKEDVICMVTESQSW